jgi:hypothetical protein
MSIQAIEAQIIATVATVTEINASYTYPVADLGRKLPALVVIYDGFQQTPGPDKATDLAWRWEFTLFLPAEGKSLEKSWTDLKALVPKVLQAFRRNPGLDGNGTCWTSIIEAGDPIIHAAQPGAPTQFVGHTFRLVARKEEI